MSLFSNNISNDIPIAAKVQIALQDIVNDVVDKVNNRFGECRINPETFGVVCMNTFDTFWYELGLELAALNAYNEKYKKYEEFCIQITKKDIDKLSEGDDMTELEFSLIANFLEPSNNPSNLQYYIGYKFPLHAKINSHPKWP